MDITVICIGKLKEKYWTDAVSEYSRRLKRFCDLNIIQLKEARLPLRAGKAEEDAVRESEGEEILSKIKDGMYVIALEIGGNRLSSEGLAARMKDLLLSGRAKIAFIIGGSLGLSHKVSERADYSLSFSDMTFPHQMMRVILLEQIYRSFKINHHETYHK